MLVDEVRESIRTRVIGMCVSIGVALGIIGVPSLKQVLFSIGAGVECRPLPNKPFSGGSNQCYKSVGCSECLRSVLLRRYVGEILKISECPAARAFSRRKAPVWLKPLIMCKPRRKGRVSLSFSRVDSPSLTVTSIGFTCTPWRRHLVLAGRVHRTPWVDC
ncbi:MAG: hypothetical protein CM1200mP41_21350 [Gammaproteobacteria bacterium]|nr:MAG: hypothetical protein CM1200mP41_21350 [Gammaproteobacteria bacterium]